MPQVFTGQWPEKPNLWSSVNSFLITIWQSIMFLVVKQGMIAISPRKSLQQPNTKAAFKTNSTMQQCYQYFN